jgi:Fe-S cluster assembly scaffold protein SufB
MLSLAQVQSLSDSLNETPCIKKLRIEAYDALSSTKPTIALPMSLPIERGEGCATAISSQPFGEKWTQAIAGEMQRGGVGSTEVALFEERFGTLLIPASSPELLRHYAFLTMVHFIYIEPGQKFTHPVQITFTNTHEWAATHVVVVVGKGSSLTIIEELFNDQGGEDYGPSGDNTGLWSHGVEVFLEDGAELEYVSAQRADTGAHMFTQQRSSVGEEARMHWQNVTIGGETVQHDLVSDVRGMHGESSVDWIFYSKETEKQSISAHNIFHAKDGTGEITMKGVAEGKAHTVCNGMIDIELGGGGTDTYLTEDVLMLDKTAKVDAIPGLEIKTNDVKASHSATVSKVTAADLFYFASRGITEKEARQMYVLGFLGDLTQKISDEEERESVLEAITTKYSL